MRVSLVFFLAAALFACSGSSERGGHGAFDEHSVVLIVVDSLRADHLGAYGYERPTSPFLDRLAEEGVLFERAYSTSTYTAQAAASLLSGRLPTSGGSIGLLEAQPSEEVTSLPQLARRAGFTTGIVSNQPLIRGRGFTRGFDDIQIGPAEAAWSAAEVTEGALGFVDDAGDERFMLYLHYLDPHQPYAPPEEFTRRFVGETGSSPWTLSDLTARYDETLARGEALEEPGFVDLIGRYDAEIAFVDAAVEALLLGLRERTVDEDTLIVITSTHGQEFLEHGYVGDTWTLYEEVLRIPLILWSPGELEPGRVASPVSVIDLFPTLVELLNLPKERDDLDGQSLLKLEPGGAVARPSPRPRIAELIIKERCILRGVIDGDWKYLAASKWVPPEERHEVARSYREIVAAMIDGEMETPPVWGEAIREELYNLAEDPGETHNLVASASDQLAEMRQVLAGYRAHCEKNGLRPRDAVRAAPVIGSEAAADLETLGYL